MNKTVAVIAAHPDDEVLGCGGTITFMAKSGYSVHILFISDGDALDIMTNNLLKAYISGRSISLETHQTKLWKRYSNKFSN